jgi:hypothetical protein
MPKIILKPVEILKNSLNISMLSILLYLIFSIALFISYRIYCWKIISTDILALKKLSGMDYIHLVFSNDLYSIFYIILILIFLSIILNKFHKIKNIFTTILIILIGIVLTIATVFFKMYESTFLITYVSEADRGLSDIIHSFFAETGIYFYISSLVSIIIAISIPIIVKIIKIFDTKRSLLNKLAYALLLVLLITTIITTTFNSSVKSQTFDDISLKFNEYPQ